MKEITISSGRIFIVGTVTGLVSEGRRVKDLLEKTNPDVVTLPLPEEQVLGLKSQMDGEEEEEYVPSNYEEIYVSILENFGTVRAPPPEYRAALAFCRREKKPVFAVDFGEERYSYEYCDSVSTRDLLRHSGRVKRLRRRPFPGETARDFSLAWDKALGAIDGFKHLEEKREKHMANKLFELSGAYSHIFAIVEMPRMDGVASKLAKLASALDEPGDENSMSSGDGTLARSGNTSRKTKGGRK